MKKIILVCCIALLLVGCQSQNSQNTICINICDRNVTTKLETELPKTVQELLKEAEIEIGDNDDVTPGLDTVIDSEQDIVIARENTVTLSTDEETKELVINGGQISDLLEQENITLDKNEYVNYDLDTYIQNDMYIKVYHLFSVTIECDGETIEKEFTSMNVGEALEECNITLGEDDRVSPSLSKKLKDGMEITVNRVTYDTVVETQVIKYETTYQNDSSMQDGQTKVVNSGVNGEKEVTYKVTYVDGTEESREVIDETITKEPVNATVKVGTKKGRTVTSKKAYYDCDGSGHGYYEIHYSDGTVEYEEF